MNPFPFSCRYLELSLRLAVLGFCTLLWCEPMARAQATADAAAGETDGGAEPAALTTLYRFGSGGGLSAPGVAGSARGGLIESGDGNFYGTTAGGGRNNAGTIFSATLGAPTITSSTTPVATTGVTFNYAISGTGGPTSFGASGLPTGLSINTVSGLISGAFSTPGTYTLTVSATNGVGTGSATVTLTVNPSRVH